MILETRSDSVLSSTSGRVAVCYQRRGVVCGRRGCKRCPHRAYWYAFVTVNEHRAPWQPRGYRRGKKNCIYIGKVFTPLTGADVDEEERRALARWEAAAMADAAGA